MNTLTLRRKALAAALAGTLVLAACGDDDDDGGADTTAAGATEATGGAETTAGGTDATGGTDDGGGTDGTTGGTPPAGTSSWRAGGLRHRVVDRRADQHPRRRAGARQQSGGDLPSRSRARARATASPRSAPAAPTSRDASRPINDEEIAACEESGVEYVELEVAIDGLTVATSPANDGDHVPRRARPLRPRRPGVRGHGELERHERAGHRGRVGVRGRLPGRAAGHLRPR